MEGRIVRNADGWTDMKMQSHFCNFANTLKIFHFSLPYKLSIM